MVKQLRGPVRINRDIVQALSVPAEVFTELHSPGVAL